MRDRPLLNYYGGKWRIANWIISNFPDHKIYCEPFGGSLSVLLKKQRSKREIVNDIDKELVNLYMVARDHGLKLKEKLILTPHSRCEYQSSMAPSDDAIEQARRTIIRCYFGIGDSFLWNHNAFRASTKSNICVAKSWNNYCLSFDSIIKRLRGVTIECLTYEKIFNKYDSVNTLWYLDPPYLPSTRSRKHGYREDWTEMKHLQFIGDVKNLKGSVVLSGYWSELYDFEFSNWKSFKKETNVQGGKVRNEYIWVKHN